MTTPRRVLVAALGSPYRGDDGLGPAVARRLAALAPGVGEARLFSDPLELIGWWDGADLAVVADAMRSGAAPGTVAVVDLDAAAGNGPAAGAGGTSTHTVGLARALQLGRAVGRAPRRAVVVAVEGADFRPGDSLSPAAARAVPVAAERVLLILREAGSCA